MDPSSNLYAASRMRPSTQIMQVAGRRGMLSNFITNYEREVS